MKEAKWLSWGGLTNSWKRREVKSKRERTRCIQLKAEFQRRPRREKKILSEQCKEIEENKRVGKTSDLFKKIGGTKGIFHAKMVTINDRNSKDLTEAEEINKRWQEYKEELYKKCLSTEDWAEFPVLYRRSLLVVYFFSFCMKIVHSFKCSPAQGAL